MRLPGISAAAFLLPGLLDRLRWLVPGAVVRIHRQVRRLHRPCPPEVALNCSPLTPDLVHRLETIALLGVINHGAGVEIPWVDVPAGHAAISNLSEDHGLVGMRCREIL